MNYAVFEKNVVYVPAVLNIHLNIAVDQYQLSH